MAPAYADVLAMKHFRPTVRIFQNVTHLQFQDAQNGLKHLWLAYRDTKQIKPHIAFAVDVCQGYPIAFSHSYPTASG